MINDRIQEGDIVYVKRQDYLDDKDIGVFLLDNNEVTIKRIKINDNDVILKASNNNYDDRHFKFDEIQILGKVIHNKVLF